MSETAPALIVGLGNPGRQFRRNRHNIGFMVLDTLAASLNTAFTRHQSQALVTDGRLDARRVYLAKPQTYMNLVGSSVGPLARYYRVPPEATLVVYDDLDLPLGSLRLRPGGGSGGHRGMASILAVLGEAVPRLRLGIGRPPGRMDPADYVLEDFLPVEADAVREAVERAVACIAVFLAGGLEAAMTRFNASAD